MAQTVGIIDLIWKGQKIDTEKGASFYPGGLINNVVIAGRRMHNCQEWMNGEVECVTVLKAGASPTGLYDPIPGELQAILDTGQTVVWANAFMFDKRPKVTAGEGGKVPLKWAVDEAQELLS
jgi:hypothetical protein